MQKACKYPPSLPFCITGYNQCHLCLANLCLLQQWPAVGYVPRRAKGMQFTPSPLQHILQTILFVPHPVLCLLQRWPAVGYVPRKGQSAKGMQFTSSPLHHSSQPVPLVSHPVVLAAAVACCWICARKRAERKRHAALGGKVPAALPDIEQPPAQEPAAQEQAETEQPTKPLQEGQPMSHPVEQFKMPGASGHDHGIPM